MFEWKQEYSVGIPSIDAQHQNLFAIARELHAAMSSGQGRAVSGRILGRLIQYTGAHFGHEERLMRVSGYPELDRHKEQHVALTRQVLQFQKDFEAGRVAITVQLLQFIKQWLEHHIQESDKAYAPCVKAKAVA